MRTIYHNARVFTGALPLQEAFLVEDDRFSAVGTSQAVLAMEADSIVDLKGAFVCPGFNDSHMHLVSFGQTLSIAPLHQHTRSLADMLQCLSLTSPGPGGWILGRGWNQDLFTDTSRMPTRFDLDQVSTTHPVCAVRACGHALTLNSLALEQLGINAAAPEMEGGRIVRENGAPNGILLDNAMELVYSKLPVPSKEELKSMIRAACQALNAQGITSCHSDDYSTFQNLPWATVNEAYQELADAGELTVRVCEQANFTSIGALENFLALGNCTGAGDDHFRIGPLKLLGDGALGARTAYLKEPYADDPSTRGLSVFTPEEFDSLIGCANAQGMQVAVHCIGDACLDLVLSSIEKAQKSHPREDHRHGIVHCQITRPDQLKKIARLGLHVYAQSIFLDYDLHIVEQRVGAELAASSYSWKTIRDLGSTVSNGSDCPVELPNVLGGIQCAVTRRGLNGAGPYLPQQAFTVEEALQSFTAAGSYASFEEAEKGRIQKGMLADFTILNGSPFEIPRNQISKIQILETCLGGRTVYHANEVRK